MIIHKLRLLKKKVKFLSHSTNLKFECNICEWKDITFQSDIWHPNTICPKCKSQVRHRLFYQAVLTFKDLHVENIFKNKNILHFAPEKVLQKILKRNAKQYFTADLFSENYSKSHKKIDITNMQTIENESVDCVIAFDVLEHVNSYQHALIEIYRVLTQQGLAILTVPQKDDLKVTFEDEKINTPELREKYYGQYDHVRVFGNDFLTFLEQAGFKITIVESKNFNIDIVRKHVLYPPIVSENPLATNNRKIYFCMKK